MALTIILLQSQPCQFQTHFPITWDVRFPVTQHLCYDPYIPREVWFTFKNVRVYSSDAQKPYVNARIWSLLTHYWLSITRIQYIERSWNFVLCSSALSFWSFLLQLILQSTEYRPNGWKGYLLKGSHILPATDQAACHAKYICCCWYSEAAASTDCRCPWQCFSTGGIILAGSLGGALGIEYYNI
jgi:hypothetical protein